MLIWNKKKSKSNPISEETEIAVEKTQNHTSQNNLSVLKHNQICIVNKLSNKIDETGFATENLIGITVFGQIFNIIQFGK